MRIDQFDLFAFMLDHRLDHGGADCRSHDFQVDNIEDFLDHHEHAVLAAHQTEQFDILSLRLAIAPQHDAMPAFMGKSQRAAAIPHGAGRNLLHPIEHGQTHRLALSRHRQEHERAFGLVMRRIGCLGRRHVDLVGNLARLGNARCIQQHDRPPVVGQRNAGIEAGGHQQRRRRFDHQFFMIHHRIDRQRITAPARNRYDDHRTGTVAVDPEHAGERNAGHACAANRRHLFAARPIDPHLPAFQRQDFGHRAARDGEQGVAAPQGEAWHDAERQRQAHHDGEPMAGIVAQFDRAAHLVDRVAYDIHAHAPPRQIGHRLGRGKARLENQLGHVALAHRCRLLGPDDALGNRLGADPLGIEPTAIVGHFDHDLIARLLRGQVDDRLRGFSGRAAHLGRFDAMIHAVAQDMHDRIADDIDHFPVDLDIAALDLQQNILLQVQRGIAHQPGKADEQPVDGLQADEPDRIAHLRNAGGQPRE